MRASSGVPNLTDVTVHFLAPGAPVLEGRLAVVRARRDRSAPTLPAVRWDWDDGAEEAEADAFATDRPLRRVHRYAAPGVYRVRVEAAAREVDARESSAAARFVTVRARGQVGASGWVCDEATGSRIPFGFLVSTDGGGGTGVTLRCLVDSGEMEAVSLGWLMSDPPASLHFGGECRLGLAREVLRYRVDVRKRETSVRVGQHLTLTLYSSRAVPGRDSPVLRVAGPIRPGRADVVHGGIR